MCEGGVSKGKGELVFTGLGVAVAPFAPMTSDVLWPYGLMAVAAEREVRQQGRVAVPSGTLVVSPNTLLGFRKGGEVVLAASAKRGHAGQPQERLRLQLASKKRMQRSSGRRPQRIINNME